MKRLTSASRRSPTRPGRLRPGILGLLVLAGGASAQSFGLDDNPAGPLVGSPGAIPGFGAEDPFGLVGPPLAPSPSLGFLTALGDGAWLSPGPIVQHPGPNGFYIDAFSGHHVDSGLGLLLEFSVDRVTVGAPGSAVGVESVLGQAHGDVYAGTHTYVSPGTLAGTLPAAPFAGILPAVVGGTSGNVLITDESALGLLTPLGIVPPGVPVPPPLLNPGQNDNVDSWDNSVFDANGDGFFDVDAYFTLYPDEALGVGLSAADVVAVAAGDVGTTAVAYAPFAAMGLSPGDSIDALAMFDNGAKPVPLGMPGSPGAIEPLIDYALFSLAPGSPSLAMFGLDAADVFFTDFTGAFGVYAPSASLGLRTTPPGLPFAGDSVDALDSVPTSDFVIRDGDCEYVLTNTSGERLSGAGGLAGLSTATVGHVYQNWFWYRGPGDSREYALSNPIHASASGNRARLVYLEPIADGTLPGALLFDLEYTISDVSPGRFASVGGPGGLPGTVGGTSGPVELGAFGLIGGERRRCEVVIAIKVRNLTAAPASVALFSYNDMDVNGASSRDTAVIAGVDDQVQLVSDPSPLLTQAVYKVSSTDHAAWEIDAFPFVRNKLTDAVASGLAGAVSPFGPGDYAGGQEWALTLGPAGSVVTVPFDEWVGSVVLEVDARLAGPLFRRPAAKRSAPTK